jgi:hypothetical protein
MPVPIIIYAALAAMQAMSGNAQAATIREQAKRKQLIANMNAEFAEVDAWEAEQQGFADSARYQNVIDQTVGTQRVAYASQNVDINYGTAAEKQSETRITGMLNTLDIQKQARQKAAGFKKEAMNLRMGGEMQRQEAGMNANATQQAGYMNAANTALSGYSRNTNATKTTVPQGTTEKVASGPSLPWSDLSDDYRQGNLRADTEYKWG